MIVGIILLAIWVGGFVALAMELLLDLRAGGEVPEGGLVLIAIVLWPLGMLLAWTQRP